ncbi:MAG TPA: hypothetical protein VFQ14_05625 [Thermoleophilaceae bacterium]|nr:hypothetical protein [Thermoleophilaceae bacterium]
MWGDEEKLGFGAWLGLGCLIVLYVAGLAGTALLAGEGALGLLLAFAIAVVWSFALGFAAGRNEALMGPVVAVIVLIATQAPTPDDYGWMDTGPVVLIAFLIQAALLVPALGVCVSAGVRAVRANGRH